MKRKRKIKKTRKLNNDKISEMLALGRVLRKL
jgi:hypothetical protein